jgi:1,4-dihydroxy-6-naphthoate synthase
MRPPIRHRKFTLGFSPCPNDTFIFDALVNHKIDTHGFEFEAQLEDVQTLNEWAMDGKLDFSKISYGVLPLIIPQYAVMESGGALGRGVGPLLITKDPNARQEDVAQMRIAIPGVNTTAHMLFSMAFPDAHQKEFLVFNEIEEAVLDGTVDAGVIIHENRFTYKQKGLYKLIDLGDYWEKQTKLPIPLGGIVGHRRIEKELVLEVDQLIKRSAEYAFSHYPQLSPYVKIHAQEMSPQVMKQHIDLYVNDFSLWLGDDGKTAVAKLLEVYHTIYPDYAFSTETAFLGD